MTLKNKNNGAADGRIAKWMWGIVFVPVGAMAYGIRR